MPPRENCFLSGIDITEDGKVAIFGSYGSSTPTLFAAQIEPMRLKNPVSFSLANSSGLSSNATVPALSGAGYRGSGPIYVSISGTGSGSQPGVISADFSESAGTITVTAATPINSPNQYDGLIQPTANLLIVSEWFNTLQVFTINSDGSLSPTSQGPVVNPNANGAYSFIMYPDYR